MAQFNVTARTYRFQRLHERGEKLEVPEEEIHQHCDSIALEPGDEECKEAILIYAPDSKAAKKIVEERGAEKKKADREEAFKKAKTELAKKAELLAAKKAELAKAAGEAKKE
jgi:hypothetical protein